MQSGTKPIQLCHDFEPWCALRVNAGAHLAGVGMEDRLLQAPVARAGGARNHGVHGVDNGGNAGGVERFAHARRFAILGARPQSRHGGRQ